MLQIYESGKQFMDENAEILHTYPLETSFFEGNAKGISDRSKGFFAKVSDGDSFLMASRAADFPMVLFGEEHLCGALAEGLYKNKLEFGRVLAAEKLAESFLICYEEIAGGKHRLRHAMDIMRCSQLHESDTRDVLAATPDDAPEIAKRVVEFHLESLQEQWDEEEVLKDVQRNIAQFVLIRRGDIVAVARKARETERLCAISSVYTCREVRGQGLARQLVTCLTREILRDGKIAYLYVDRHNPISNHLYQSIGFVYDAPQVEMQYSIE
ncbi:MAG: GNAT family N-acetyltransferase [Acetatifactor sp.]|nr:GNAT family N-acetyltransferase [Acetatifactor sp.]